MEHVFSLMRQKQLTTWIPNKLTSTGSSILFTFMSGKYIQKVNTTGFSISIIGNDDCRYVGIKKEISWKHLISGFQRRHEINND